MDHDALIYEFKRLKKEIIRLREENILLRTQIASPGEAMLLFPEIK